MSALAITLVGGGVTAIFGIIGWAVSQTYAKLAVVDAVKAAIEKHADAKDAEATDEDADDDSCEICGDVPEDEE